MRARSRGSASLSQPIGILGGTFDPIHCGHLRFAQEAVRALALAELRFIPAGVPPHRPAPLTSAQHRLEMVKRAVGGLAKLTLDEREIAKTAPCYTVETLASLRGELGAGRPLCLLLGADAFLGLPGWHKWRELFRLAHVVAASRPGFDALGAAPELHAEVKTREAKNADALREKASGAVFFLSMAALDVSSTRIRQALLAGDAAADLLPPAVLDYIQNHKLYSQEADEA